MMNRNKLLQTVGSSQLSWVMSYLQAADFTPSISDGQKLTLKELTFS